MFTCLRNKRTTQAYQKSFALSNSIYELLHREATLKPIKIL